MKHDSHLRSALLVLHGYDGSIPLAAFLKSFFRLHPNMGSRDRKSIASLVYNYYRLGHALQHMPEEERLLAAAFLCNDQPSELLAYFHPAWVDMGTVTLEKKLAYLQSQGLPVQPEEIFPWRQWLSPGISFDDFAHSFLRQPDVYLRIRSHREEIIRLLQAHHIPFTEKDHDCIALPNGTKATHLIPEKSWYEVQDDSSRKVARYFDDLHMLQKQPAPLVWDCCAGSGGKSILLHDRFPDVRLVVSDVRPSILHNLQQRFREAGVSAEYCTTADLEKGLPAAFKKMPFSLIMADVPCSGSGTWARTPERLFFFEPASLEHFTARQKHICNHALKALRKGSGFLYITCSVFHAENGDMVTYLRSQAGLRLLRSGLLKGYDDRADNLFAAAFILE